MPHPLHAAILALAAASTVPAQRDERWFNDLAFPPAGSVQAGRAVFDSGSGQVLLWRSNAQTLAWNGSALTPVGLTGPSLTGVAISESEVPGLSGVLAFGGASVSVATSNQLFMFVNGVWGRIFPAGSPPARAHAAMAPLGNGMVLFGGRDATGAALGDTWVLGPGPAGLRWLGALGPPDPAPREDAALCPDGTGNLLLFGGRAGAVRFNDTWRFDGFAWTQLTPTQSPPPGASPMAYDPLRNEIILVDPPTGVTWRFDPTTDDWQPLPTSGLPMPVPFAASLSGGPTYMAFDRTRAEHVFVDASLGLSLFTVADAQIGNRQPAACAPRLRIGLGAGAARLGQVWVVDVSLAAPSAPVGIAVGTGPRSTPLPVTASGCASFFANWLLTSVQLADGSGATAFAVAAPNSPLFLGFLAEHQAMDFAAFGVSDDLAVRIAR